MEITEQHADIIVLVIGLPLFIVAVYLWANAFKHMVGLLNNFKSNMYWGRYLPFCIFMPTFFTEQGNIHRVALLKYAGLFIAFCGIPLIAIGLWGLFFK